MYQIVIKKKAKKFIDRLPLNEKKRVVAAIERLPNGEDIKKLKGHADLLRLRVGEYRIIYTVDHGELTVGHAASLRYFPQFQVILRSLAPNFHVFHFRHLTFSLFCCRCS